MDTSREMRAMAMVAFPCPPLPVSGAGQDGSPKVINSHDLLAFLMNTAALRRMEGEDQDRMQAQAALIDAFAQGPLDWEAMTSFSRSYMMLYCPSYLHQLRFLPGDAITPRLRAQVCQWLAARHILQGQPARAEEFRHLTPAQLYARCSRVQIKPN